MSNIKRMLSVLAALAVSAVLSTTAHAAQQPSLASSGQGPGVYAVPDLFDTSLGQRPTVGQITFTTSLNAGPGVY